MPQALPQNPNPKWSGADAARHAQLASFIERLCDDAAFRSRFRNDPAACMHQYGLSAAERRAVKAGQQAVRELLAPGVAAAMMLGLPEQS